MSSESAYSGTQPHRPLTWLAGLLLLVAVLLGGRAPGTASVTGVEPAHKASLTASDTIPSAAPQILSLADVALEAIESSSEGDDGPPHTITTAIASTTAVSLATRAITASPASRRWRHRGQAPPLA